MSKLFKWAVVKAASAASRKISTLFFQLYYREMFREIDSLTKNPEKTVEIARSIGYSSAKESAERRSGILKLFPGVPERLVEYLSLIWQIYFGSEMGDYTIDVDDSDSEYPIYTYIIKENPLIFGIGDDPENDNLPFKDFWGNGEGYLSLVSGMMTQVLSFILEIKEQDKRIVVKHNKSYLHNDNKFTLQCQIIPADQYNEMIISDIEIDADVSDGGWQENLLKKISDFVDIDDVYDLVETPTSGIKLLISSVSEKFLHMEVSELLGHFTNYEEEFFKVLGWIAIHALNEMGRIPEKLFKDPNNENFNKIFAQLFLNLEKNAEKIAPITTIKNLQDYFKSLFEEFNVDEFASQFKSIPPEKIVELMLSGTKKALQDIGLNFENLEDSLYKEFKKMNKGDSLEPSESEKSKENDEFMEKLVDQFLLISTTIFSFPFQILLSFLHSSLSYGNDFFKKIFDILKSSANSVPEFIDKINLK